MCLTSRGFTGSTVVLLPAVEPAEVLDLIERWRYSYFFILPAMLQLVVEQARKIFHRKSPYAELLRGPGTGAPAPRNRFTAAFDQRRRRELRSILDLSPAFWYWCVYAHTAWSTLKAPREQ
jgi:hypothetical protein